MYILCLLQKHFSLNYLSLNNTFSLNQITNIVEGRYVFRLKVTDDQGAFSEDTVSVNVKPGKINFVSYNYDIIIND